MTDTLDIDVPAPEEIRCRDCRRLLSDPESRAREIGPDCWEKGHAIPAPRRVGPSLDQPALPIDLPDVACPRCGASPQCPLCPARISD